MIKTGSFKEKKNDPEQSSINTLFLRWLPPLHSASLLLSKKLKNN